jgi:broad specificity phosphatase PhoE
MRSATPRLWSSDLARARETVSYLAAETGLPVSYDARLREFDVGERAGLNVAEFAERFPIEYASWRAGHITGGVPGAETPSQVIDRMVPALQEIWAAIEPGATTVVVSHGACLKVALVALLGWPDEIGNKLRGLDNCGWFVLEADPYGRGLRLVSYNESVRPTVRAPEDDADRPLG